MTLEEAIKIGLGVPEKYWLDMSPIDEHEEAARVLAQALLKERERSEKFFC